MGKLDCRQVKELAISFIANQLSETLHNSVLEHLMECNDCFEYYCRKASSLNQRLNLDKKISMPTTDVDTFYVNWTDAVKNNDLSALMQSKAIRDSVQENYNVADDGSEDEVFREFGLFLIKKICQKIDHLENCLSKSEEASKNA